MIEIDGSILEGGGQLLRVSVALSAVTRKPIRVYNVRANRAKPGLRAQHLSAVEAVARLVNAKTHGLALGSKEIQFIPGSTEAKHIEIDVGTAGSTSLVLQAMMPAMAFTKDRSSAVIRGGTNNPMAPPVDFLERTLLPTLRRMGLDVSLKLVRRGFYPRGQGIVEVEMEPARKVAPITMTDFAQIRRITGLAYSSRLPQHVVDRLISAAKSSLAKAEHLDLSIEREVLQPDDPRCAVDPGCGITLVAELASGGILSGDSLGVLGKPAEKVGSEAAYALIEQLKLRAPVGKHLADQLVIWMGLAEGISEIRVCELTLHTLTCIEVVQDFVDAQFTVDGDKGKPATIKCRGIGLRNIATGTA